MYLTPTGESCTGLRIPTLFPYGFLFYPPQLDTFPPAFASAYSGSMKGLSRSSKSTNKIVACCNLFERAIDRKLQIEANDNKSQKKCQIASTCRIFQSRSQNTQTPTSIPALLSLFFNFCYYAKKALVARNSVLVATSIPALHSLF